MNERVTGRTDMRGSYRVSAGFSGAVDTLFSCGCTVSWSEVYLSLCVALYRHQLQNKLLTDLMWQLTCCLRHLSFQPVNAALSKKGFGCGSVCQYWSFKNAWISLILILWIGIKSPLRFNFQPNERRHQEPQPADTSPSHTVLLTGDCTKWPLCTRDDRIRLQFSSSPKIKFHISSSRPKQVSSPSLCSVNTYLSPNPPLFTDLTSWKCPHRALRSKFQVSQCSQSLLG